MSADWLRSLVEDEQKDRASVFLDEVARGLGDMSARRQCAEHGHRYQIHGKTNPTKLACSRCRVTWAIGARTEPA